MLFSSAAAETSASVLSRVLAARAIQNERRERGEVRAPSNAQLSNTELERVAALDAPGKRLLEAAVSQLGLSARAFMRVLRVARSVADLEGATHVRTPHLAEAIQGRLLDRETLH